MIADVRFWRGEAELRAEYDEPLDDARFGEYSLLDAERQFFGMRENLARRTRAYEAHDAEASTTHTSDTTTTKTKTTTGPTKSSDKLGNACASGSDGNADKCWFKRTAGPSGYEFLISAVSCKVHLPNQT